MRSRAVEALPGGISVLPATPRRFIPAKPVPTAVRVQNLVKRYDGRPPVEAVRGLDLVIEQGECFGLLGPNGAGKTTTIEIIEGLLAATSGDVEVLGLRWGRNDDAIRQRIGISLQETRLSEKLSVLETLTLFRSFYRQGIEPEAAMRRVSLEEKAKSWIGKLSGGQKQRLAVACALVGDPELLFLDEPTTGLDPQSRRQLWDIIRGFREQGRTVLLTTHYMDEAERLCDRVAIVDQGRVIALGTPRQLIATLGGEHVIEITLDDSCTSSAGGESSGRGRLSPDGARGSARGNFRSGGEWACLPGGDRAAPRPAGPVGSPEAHALRIDQPHYPPCQPGRRVRKTCGSAFVRRIAVSDFSVSFASEKAQGLPPLG